MKIIAFGDIHGRNCWQQIVSNIEYDKVVFLGDYFDSHERISEEHQVANFIDLTELKRNQPEKVILLFGNHDYHYLSIVKEQYSGFQKNLKPIVQELLSTALEDAVLQMCYSVDNYIFTHAGITNTWLKRNRYKDGLLYEKFINDLFLKKPSAFKFTVGENNSPFGDDTCQSPIWVRPQSLMSDTIKGYIQIVGHTPKKEIILNQHVVVIDTLGRSGQFLLIEDGRMFVLDQDGNI
jgi:predicted MPP superfamily phosphohydrolase